MLEVDKVSVDLTENIVRILKRGFQASDPKATAGTGFIVSDKGLIATCAHVVQLAGFSPGETLSLIFHSTGQEYQAIVLSDYWRSPDREDISILRLTSSLPDMITPLLLGSSHGTEGHIVRTFGFLAQKPIEGLPGDGRIIGGTTEAGSPVLIIESKQITSGFSGAPLLDTHTRRVIGMVTSILIPDQFSHVNDVASATRSEIIKEVCPELQISDICPYRSLEAFTEDDSRFFFGRQRVTDKLIEKLRQHPRFLAVLGPSGSGKSSVVSAGLIPQLKLGTIPGSDNWIYLTTRPSNIKQFSTEEMPGAMENMVSASANLLHDHPKSTRIVLFIDQFEEAFIQSESENDSLYIQLTNLLNSAIPVTVILTLRDDFYSVFVQKAPDLVPWLEDGQANVPYDLQENELNEIISEPARSVGLTFESGLIADIAKDAAATLALSSRQDCFAQAAVLPLLEFVLTQLWQRRQDGVFTHSIYDNLGGVAGALTLWADDMVARLNDQGYTREIQRIFTDLVHLGNESLGNPDSRQKVLISALIRHPDEEEKIRRILQTLSGPDARLIVTARDQSTGLETVELIHDAILQRWAKLQNWIKEDRKFLEWRQFMDAKVNEWILSNPKVPEQRDTDKLLRRRDLETAEEWIKSRKVDMGDSLLEFITASIELRAIDRNRQEQERKTKERLLQQKNLAASIALAVFIILSVITGVFWHRAILATRSATSNLARAYKEQGKVALADRQMLVAETWFANSLALQDDLETREFLLGARAKGASVNSRISNALRKHIIKFDRDGTRFATIDEKHIIGIEYLGSEKTRQILPIQTGKVICLAFSDDGHYIAWGCDDGGLYFWDTKQVSCIPLKGHDGPVQCVALDKTGTHLASGDKRGNLFLWDTSHLSEPKRLNVPKEWVRTVTFSPDGKWLASGGWSDRIVRRFNVSTGKWKKEFKESNDVIQSIAFSNNGKYLAVGCWDNILYRWDLKDMTSKECKGHKTEIWDIAFSSDDALIATASSDKTIRIWDSRTTTLLLTLTTNNLPISSVGFSADGKSVYGGGEQGGLCWNIRTRPETVSFHTDNAVLSIAYSPDGAYVASGYQDGSISMWDIRNGEHKKTYKPSSDSPSSDSPSKAPKWCLAFSQDGHSLAVGDEQGTISLWDVQGSNINNQKILLKPSEKLNPDEKKSVCWHSVLIINGLLQLVKTIQLA